MNFSKIINLSFVLIFALSACSPALNKPDLTSPTLIPEESISASPTKIESPTPTQTPQPTQPPVEIQAEPDPTLDLEALNPDQEITIQFSEAVEMSVDEPALLFYPNVEGKITWNQEHTRLTFHSDQGLEGTAQYLASLHPGLRTMNGEPLKDNLVWKVNTITRPEILTSSAKTRSGTDLEPIFIIHFSQEMDVESVQSHVLVEPETMLDFVWEEDGKKVSITPKAPFSPGNTYQFRISGDATSAQNLQMTEDYVWSYTTKPYQFEVSSYVYKKIFISFNYPMATDTIPFNIQPEIPGEWSWVNDRKLSFTSDEPLETYNYLKYELIPNPELLNIPETSLETLVYKTPSIISRTWPKDGEHIENFKVSITFKKAVNHQSVEDAFFIEPHINGNFSWNKNILTYTFSESPINFQTYTVTIDNTITDESGQPALLEPHQFTFDYYFWGYDNAVTFAEYGPNLQVIDSNGRRSTQFSVNVTNTPILYNAYKLGFDEFLQRFIADFGNLQSYYYGYGNRIKLSTEGMEPYFSWQESFEDTGFKDLVMPSQLENGFYILTANALDTGVTDSMFIVLSPNTLVVKQELDSFWVWASDINGETTPDMELRLYSDRGEKIRTVNMGEDGIAEVTIPEGYNPMLVAAIDKNGDITISGLSANWKALTEYDEKYGQLYLSHLYTDRPIYQPGQTVFYKGIVRKNLDTTLDMPGLAEIQAEIRDPNDNLIHQQTLNLNEFGSIFAEYPLPEGVGTGYYTITLKTDKEILNQEFFLVENYTKPQTKLTLTVPEENHIAGDNAKINLSAEYLMGLPVNNAEVTLTTYLISRYSYYYFYDYEQHLYQSITNNYRNWTKIDEYSTQTDDQGKLEYFVPIEKFSDYNDDHYYYSPYLGSDKSLTVGIEACIKLESGSTNCTSTTIKVHPSAEKMKVDMPYFWYKELETQINFSVRVETLEGEPVINREINVELDPWYYLNDQKKITYTFLTDKEGFAKISFPTPENIGYYEMTITTEDDSGREQSYLKYFYAGVDGSFANWYGDSISIQIPKETYQAYENMPIYIRSEFSGPAMLTFERDTVIHAIPVELTAPFTQINTTVLPEFGPNVTIKINAYQWQDTQSPQNDDYYFEYTIPDSLLRTASTKITVPVEGKQLTIQLESGQETYQPGDVVDFHLHVEDENGHPVKAELSAALVDEALYQLRSDDTSIFDDFYGYRSSNIFTHNTLELRRIIFHYDKGGGGGGGERESEYSSVRSNFEDAVLWIPDLRTDQNGDADIQLTLPDNLTTWRLTVKANSTSQKFGQNTLTIQTQKQAMIEPLALPTLTTDDQIDLTATIFNNTEKTETFLVQLSTQEDLVNIGNASQEITLEAGESRIITWPVTANQNGSSQFYFSLTSGGKTLDQVALPYEVRKVDYEQKNIQAFFGGDQYSTTFLSDSSGNNTLNLKFWQSPLVEFSQALDYVTGYPYGCVEQTLSRVLPNTMVSRLVKEYPADFSINQSELDVFIQAGIARLYSLQHGDGSWGWWYNSEADYYFTSLAVYALSLTQQNGYTVEDKVLQDAINWMISQEPDDLDPALLAFGFYALTTAGETLPEEDLQFIDALNGNDTFSLAVTATGLWESGKTEQALEITELIKSNMVQNEKGISFPQENGTQIYWNRMDNPTRSSAMVLELLLKVEPDSRLIPGIISGLRGELRNGYWVNTNTTSFVLMAFGSYLQSMLAESENDSYQIFIDGVYLSSTQIGETDQTASVSIPLTDFQPGIHTINVISENGEVFFLSLTEIVTDQDFEDITAPIKITRRFLNADGVKTNTFEVGETIKVIIDIDLPEEMPYLMITDPLVAGFLPFNENLNNSSHNPYQKEEKYYDYTYTYSEKQIEQDQVIFFVTTTNKNRLSLIYYVQAINAGTFTARPAEIISMYDDQAWGVSDTNEVIILPKTDQED